MEPEVSPPDAPSSSDADSAQADPPLDWQELWARYPEKKALFRERMSGAPPFAPGLPALFERLYGTYKLAVVSSSSCSEIEPLLIAGGLRQYLGTVVGGGDVKRQKPDPEPYLLAATRLGVDRAIVFEDSEAGIASGRAAGFEVVRVKHPTEVPDLVLERVTLPPRS